MLQETGTVVTVESDALWVETIRQSACGSCHARQGCGQHALGKVLGTTSRIRVLLNGASPESFHVNQEVTIGVPDDVVVKGALLVYLTPLVLLLAGALLFHYWTASDGWSVIGSFLGLLVGGAVVRWHATKTRNDPRLQPVLLEGPLPSTEIVCPSSH